MKKNVFVMHALVWTLALAMVPFGAFAQAPGAARPFSPQELDQMCAPIALYPDSLLAQILIAATYPDQIMEADRWLKGSPGLSGEALNAELDRMNWDLSVKALAPFPQVIAMMAERSEWTERLGEAFLAQQADVMDSVQKLRAKAQAAGNLRSTSEQRVVASDNYIEIVPVNPEVVYIPRYDPVVVYGSWWWPTYPPFVYAPVFPGVVVGAVGVFGFWGAVTVGPVWSSGWGSWGWGNHDVNININRNVNINRTTNVTAIRSGMRTNSFHQSVAAGHIGSSQVRSAAFNRTGGVSGGTGGNLRPSATSVQQGLKGASPGGQAGKFGSGTGTGKFGSGTGAGNKQLGTSSGAGNKQLGTGSGAGNKQLGTSSGAGNKQFGTSSGAGNKQLGTNTRSNTSRVGTSSGLSKGKSNAFSGAGGSKVGAGGGGAKPMMRSSAPRGNPGGGGGKGGGQKHK